MSQSSTLIPQFAVLATALVWGLAPGDRAPGLALRETLRSNRLSQADYERMERGYYEQLLDEGRRLGAPEPAGSTRSAPPAFEAGPLALSVADVREYVLKPDLSMDHWGVRWSTNAFGMRDRPYPSAKPPGTLRIALVGDSIGSGWGVDDGQGFEPRLETALDANSRAEGGPAVEVLNCAVPGHAPGQRWDNFSRVGWDLGIDLVVYEATLADPGWDERRLRGLLPRGVGWEAPVYHDTLTGLGVHPGGDLESYKRLLRPQRWAILAGVYRTIVADCRSRGVPSLWVLIPRVGRDVDPAERARLIELARSVGFTAVLDLSDVYDGLDPAGLAIGPDDYHPNAEGHARLAQRLEVALTARPELRRLWSRPETGGEAR